MMDFMNNKELSEDQKLEEFYKLFKTKSSEFNSNLSLFLKKYTSFQTLIKKFTKIDIYDIPNIFNNIALISSKLITEVKKDCSDSDIESYISGISKIVLLLFLIQQTNQLLTNIVKNTKNYVQKFFSTTKSDCSIKREIDKIINNLISREHNIDNKNSFSNEDESMIIGNTTPHFKDLANSDKNNISFKMIENDFKNNSTKLDSSLSLQRMQFVQIEEKPEIMKVNKNKIKKSISDRINKKHKSLEPSKPKNRRNSIKKKKSLFYRKGETSVKRGHESPHERIKILTIFFDSINTLYKYGKINSQQKIKIKQKIVSEPKKIIKKFYQQNPNIEKNNDKELFDSRIQTFLMEELFCI